MLIKQKIKAFTMIELLVTMSLTGILVVFAFIGYNHIQQLFLEYSKQSTFINEYNQLNKALFIISDKSQIIEKTSDDVIVFSNDTTKTELIVKEDVVLLKFSSHTDSFKFKTEKPEFDILNIAQQPSNYIKSFRCNVMFENQKFLVSFRKQYDAESILKATLVTNPIYE